MPQFSKLDKVKEIGRQDILLAMARVPMSDRVLVGSSDFKLHEIDFAAEKPESSSAAFEGHQSYVTGVAIAGNAIVTGGYDRKLIWWNLETKKQLRAIDDAHAKWIRGVEASRDGKLIASVADDMVCRLWNAESGEKLREFRGHAEQTPHGYPSMLYACAFSPDSKHVATVDRIGHVAVWSVDGDDPVALMDAPENYTWDPKQRRHSIGGLRSCAFSPDGEKLAVGGMGQVGNIDHLEGKARVEIFNWKSAEKTHVYGENEYKGLVNSLAWHPDGKWLAAAGGGTEGWLMFFDLADTKKSAKDEKAPMHIHEIALADDGSQLWAVGHHRLVKWELRG
jgi:WD40 repeat protein